MKKMKRREKNEDLGKKNSDAYLLCIISKSSPLGSYAIFTVSDLVSFFVDFYGVF